MEPTTQTHDHTPSANNDCEEHRPLVITLVHGTKLFSRWRFWRPKSAGTVKTADEPAQCRQATGSREVKWYQSDSLFRKRLRKAIGIPCKITEFNWSGANTEWARLCAAGADKDFLEDSDPGPGPSDRSTLRKHINDYANADHVLIAHSHGGNVCLAALNDPGTQKAVRAVVCLSTPFINVRQRADSRTLNNFFHAARALLFLAAILGTIALTKTWLPEVWVGGFAIFLITTVVYWVLTERRRKALRRWASARRRAVPQPPVLALLSDGDEALLALKIVEGLNATLRGLWTLVVWIPLRIFAAQRRLVSNWRVAVPILVVLNLLILLMLFYFDVNSPFKTGSWNLTVVSRFIAASLLASMLLIFAWSFVLIIPGLIVLGVGLVGLAFTRWLAFGWPGYVGVDVTAEACPVGTSRITRLRSFRYARGMRHGYSYNDPRSPIHIARFICEAIPGRQRQTKSTGTILDS